jgi:predicted alpha/beta-hydrolase family hydrolase
MTCQSPTYNYHNKLNSETLFVIVHGGGAGIEDPFLQKIYFLIQKANQSYMAIQMPFIDRGESTSSGPETLEEIKTVGDALSQIDTTKYSKIHFIGKSLGGLVLQRFIETSSFNTNQTQFTILGYLVGDVNVKNLQANLHIIQGENDPYGKPEIVQSELDSSPSSIKKIDIIKDGDHSYRNSAKEPVFQDEAISLIQI